MNQKPNQSDALLGIWDILLRYRWRFVLPMFMVTAGVLAASLMLPRKYKAEAIFERSTDMVLAEITSKGVPRTFQDPKVSLVMEVAGETAIDELVQQLIPDSRGADARELAVRRQDMRNTLLRKVAVGFEISSNELDRIRVHFVHEDPKLAQTVVNKLVENFLSRTRVEMDGRLKRSAEFFRKEVARSHELINDLENQLLAFEIEHASLLPEAPHGVQMEQSDARNQLAIVRLKRDATELRIAALRQSLKQTERTAPSVMTGKNPERARLEESLRQMRAQLAEYVGIKMTEKHPDLIALREQIASTEAQLAATPAEVVTQTRIDSNPKYAELELLLTNASAELGSLTKQQEELERRVAELDTEATSLFPIRAGYRKLTRDVEEAQRQMAFWEDNLRRVDMAAAAESGDRGVRLDFIKPCGELHKPISPNLVQALMAAVALGLVSGAVCVFLAYRTDETINSAEELGESFGMPLFGTVSEIISDRQHRLRRWRNRVVYPFNIAVMASVLLLMAGLLYLDLEQPHVFEQLKSAPGQFFQDRVIDRVTGQSHESRVGESRVELWESREPASQGASVAAEAHKPRLLTRN